MKVRLRKISVSLPDTTGRRRDFRYDYRSGVQYAVGTPRSYQPRKGGPPLLFATDIRMTLLAHLALSAGPMRQVWLWRHLHKRAPLALYDLVERGLVAKWNQSTCASFIALDPAHPAAPELRQMLLEVARLYDGFSEPKYDVKAMDGGDIPVRKSRRRDVRYTFGDPIRTMALLLVYVLGEASAADIARCVPYVDTKSVRHVLYMYTAFGLLRRRRMVVHKRRSLVFAFDMEHPLARHVLEVVAALDRAMPLWRVTAQRQSAAPMPTRRERHDGRRKPKRWKW
jgi:hypothetical protein